MKDTIENRKQLVKRLKCLAKCEPCVSHYKAITAVEWSVTELLQMVERAELVIKSNFKQSYLGK
jgi:hypothetical protein